jgi:predicted GNAT family N-acyltransferase
MGEWQIERFDRTHVRSEFCCGKAPLDAFLHFFVTQYEKRRLGQTYVAIRPGDKRVLGYYTLASSAVSFAHLPPKAAKKLPKHPVPAALLARLAVDQSVKGQGLGRLLLAEALKRCYRLSQQIGIHAVEVDAIDEQASEFYAKYGFVGLGDNLLHMYLPITTLEDACANDPSDATE